MPCRLCPALPFCLSVRNPEDAAKKAKQRLRRKKEKVAHKKAKTATGAAAAGGGGDSDDDEAAGGAPAVQVGVSRWGGLLLDNTHWPFTARYVPLSLMLKNLTSHRPLPQTSNPTTGV